MVDINYIEHFVRNNVGEEIDFIDSGGNLKKGFVCGYASPGYIILGFNDNYGWDNMNNKLKMYPDMVCLKKYQSYYGIQLPTKYVNNNQQ